MLSLNLSNPLHIIFCNKIKHLYLKSKVRTNYRPGSPPTFRIMKSILCPVYPPLLLLSPSLSRWVRSLSNKLGPSTGKLGFGGCVQVQRCTIGKCTLLFEAYVWSALETIPYCFKVITPLPFFRLKFAHG